MPTRGRGRTSAFWLFKLNLSWDLNKRQFSENVDQEQLAANVWPHLPKAIKLFYKLWAKERYDPSATVIDSPRHSLHSDNRLLIKDILDIVGNTVNHMGTYDEDIVSAQVKVICRRILSGAQAIVYETYVEQVMAENA